MSMLFDKLYLPLYLYNIFPELGSTLWYCIEALSVPVKTAEGWYAPKTLLRRAGQYLKCNAYRHRVRPSKRLNEKRTRKTMSITGLTCTKGLDSTRGFLCTENPVFYFSSSTFFFSFVPREHVKAYQGFSFAYV